MVSMCVLSKITASIFENVPKRTLPLDAWTPFNYTTPIGFWCTYLHQISEYAISAAIGSMIDVLFLGSMFQTCAQLKLLKFRLLMMPSMIPEKTKSKGLIDERYAQTVEDKLLIEIIRHHNDIFELIYLQC